MILQDGTVNSPGVLRDVFLSFRGKRGWERPMRLQLPSPCHPAAQGSEKSLGGDPAGSHQSTPSPATLQIQGIWFSGILAPRLILPRDHSELQRAWELCDIPKLASTRSTGSLTQSDDIVTFTQPHSSFCVVFVRPRCIQPFSTTAWRSCCPGRTTTAAHRSTMPADWASTTRWRTCWGSLGRTVWRASPRTRSRLCTLLLSESNRCSPNGKECICRLKENWSFFLQFLLVCLVGWFNSSKAKESLKSVLSALFFLSNVLKKDNPEQRFTHS